MPVKAQNKHGLSERPARYLKRIVALTGARKVQGERYMLAVGRKYFLVDARFVYLLSRRGKSTCFSLLADVDTPRPEILGSALLQLKNNPKLFKKWRKWAGCPFKADGKIFRGESVIPWRTRLITEVS
jgi:hypothetical protein